MLLLGEVENHGKVLGEEWTSDFHYKRTVWYPGRHHRKDGASIEEPDVGAPSKPGKGAAGGGCSWRATGKRVPRWEKSGFFWYLLSPETGIRARLCKRVKEDCVFALCNQKMFPFGPGGPGDRAGQEQSRACVMTSLRQELTGGRSTARVRQQCCAWCKLLTHARALHERRELRSNTGAFRKSE